ncbi:hypothetical protein JXL19_12630 [bacterium]|nr:hypothetical protein [bacterium]
MKKTINVSILICCLIISTIATAGLITINLDSVPTDLECDTNCLCDQNWVVSSIVLTVTKTQNDYGCGSNECSWQHGFNQFGPVFDQGILLNPGRLVLDLNDINTPITKIEVTLEDYCPGTGCSSAAIYDGATRVKYKTSGNDNGPINVAGYFIFDYNDIGNYTIDKLVVASCDGHVGEIKITTTSSSSTSSTCSYYGCGTTLSTCSGWSCGGNTLYTCGGWNCGTTYGIGCGTTYGISCGNTFSTCAFPCGPTLSTCSYGCQTTYSTCSLGCRSTNLTCTFCDPGTHTAITCSPFCSSTSLTCGFSIECHSSATSWCYYSQAGSSLYKTSTEPTAPPVF